MENFGEAVPSTDDTRSNSRKSKQPRSRQRKMSGKGKSQAGTPQAFSNQSPMPPTFDHTMVVSDAMAINSRQLLYAHLYNYLLQNNYYETAKQFLREAEVPLSNLNNPKSPNNNSLSLTNLGANQLLKSKMIISSPDTFLLEWWQSLLLLNNFVENTPVDDLNSKLDYMPNQGFDKVYPILPRHQQQAHGYPANMYMGMPGHAPMTEHATPRAPAPSDGERVPDNEQGAADQAVRLQQQMAAAAAQARVQARAQAQGQAHMQAQAAQAQMQAQAQAQVAQAAQAQSTQTQPHIQAQAGGPGRAQSQSQPQPQSQMGMPLQGNATGPMVNGQMGHPQASQSQIPPQQQQQGMRQGQNMVNGMPMNSTAVPRYVQQQQQHQQQQMMMQQYPGMMNMGMQQPVMASQQQSLNKGGMYMDNNQVVYPTNMSPRAMSNQEGSSGNENTNSFGSAYDGAQERNPSQQQQIQAQFASQKKKQSENKTRSVSAQSQPSAQSRIQAQYQEHMQNRHRGSVNNVGPATGPQSAPDMAEAARMGMDMNDPNMQQQYMSMLKSMLLKNQNPNQPQQQGPQPVAGGDNAMVDFSMINFNMMGQNNDMGGSNANDSNDMSIEKGNN